MAASRRGTKKRRPKKSAGARRKTTSKKKTSRKKKPRKASKPRPPKPRAGRAERSRTFEVTLAGVDTIELEFTWGGGVEGTLMTLVDHERERLTFRPRDRQRISHRHVCDLGGDHPIQWDLFADGDMRAPILRGRKNDEPFRTLAQSGDTIRWQDRAFL